VGRKEGGGVGFVGGKQQKQQKTRKRIPVKEKKMILIFRSIAL
jgi:hypothetical protein